MHGTSYTSGMQVTLTWILLLCDTLMAIKTMINLNIIKISVKRQNCGGFSLVIMRYISETKQSGPFLHPFIQIKKLGCLSMVF